MDRWIDEWERKKSLEFDNISENKTKDFHSDKIINQMLIAVVVSNLRE